MRSRTETFQDALAMADKLFVYHEPPTDLEIEAASQHERFLIEALENVRTAADEALRIIAAAKAAQLRAAKAKKAP